MDTCSVKCINTNRVEKTVRTLPEKNEIDSIAFIFKAMGDPGRLNIVLSLLDHEHCVCDLAAICGQSESAVSHQLRILRTQKIVKNRRDGKIIYYSLDDDHVTSLVKLSLAHIKHQ